MFLEASKCHLHLFIYIVLLCSINPQLKFTVVPSCEDLILRGFPDPLCLLPQPQDLTQTWGVQALQLAVANEPLFLIFLGRHSSDSDPVKSRPWQIAMWHPFSRTNDTAVVKTAGNLIWPMTFLKKNQFLTGWKWVKWHHYHPKCWQMQAIQTTPTSLDDQETKFIERF
jgi:hypothetical protein